MLAASLTGNFSFADYAYTRDLEQHLDDIANGKASYSQVLQDLDRQLNAEIEALHLTPAAGLIGIHKEHGQTSHQLGFPCPKCEEGSVRRPHGQEFYGCDRYEDGCTYKISTRIAGKAITDSQAATLITKGRVGPLKGFTSKAGKPFEASLSCNEESGWKTVFDFAKER
jgi:DNA topoisomerase-3